MEEKDVTFKSYGGCLFSNNTGHLYIASRGIGLGNIGVKAYLKVDESYVDYDVTGPSYTPHSDTSYFELRGRDLTQMLSDDERLFNDSFSNGFRYSKKISYDDFQTAISDKKRKSVSGKDTSLVSANSIDEVVNDDFQVGS